MSSHCLKDQQASFVYAQVLEKEKVYLSFQHVKMCVWGEKYLTLKINNKSKNRTVKVEKFKQAYEQPQLCNKCRGTWEIYSHYKFKSKTEI